MPVPKYVELAQRLRESIQNGAYRTGQRLPSENELVAETGFSRQTVRQAMELLQRDGLTDRIRGSGTYVRSQTVRVRERTRNIAILTTYIGEYIFPNILHGIDHVLSRQGYTSLLAATRNRVDNERRMLRDLLEKPIDGMIVEGTKTALPNPNIDLYEQFARRDIPIVFFNGFYPELKDYVHVVVDDRAGGRSACQSLIDRGHKRIAGFFKSDDIQGHRRYAGYVETLRDAGLDVKDDNVLWYVTENRDSLIQSSAASVMEGCTAAVCYNDEVALRVIQAMGDALRGAEIAGMDGSTIAQLSAYPIHSQGHPSEQVGRVAAQKLLNLLAGEHETSVMLMWNRSNAAK